MCPHEHHPSPDFQRLMQPLSSTNHYQQAAKTGAYAGTCWLDGFLIWPVAGASTDCTISDPNLNLGELLSYQHHSSRKASDMGKPAMQQDALAKAAGNASATGAAVDGQHFCIHRGAVPILLKPGSRPANVEGHSLPAPEEMERCRV